MPGTPTEFNRDALITIQGGGVFGLFLIGQLEYVLQDLEIKPLAYAGTSAGAILATLSWAGYSPRQIRELLVAKADSQDGIVSLLGPFDSSFDFSDLGQLRARFGGLKARVPGLLDALKTLKGWDKKKWWKKWKALSVLMGQLDVNLLLQAFQDGETVLSLANALGCFAGDGLELQMEEWLRSSPLFKDYLIPDGQERLTFRHARKASESNPVPPLFLAATNLSTRSLELISSIKDDDDEYDYDDVSIARAVRASASVPGFFRPVRIRINNSDVSLADGGWISNYPMWVFSKDLRRRLLKMPAHQVLGSKPWVHVGLRLFPKSQSVAKPISTFGEFAGASFELATGGARSEMDDRATPRDGRLIHVWQKPEDADAIQDFLDLSSFSTNVVRRCFTDGREAAQTWLGRMSFALPDADPVEELLNGLANFAEEVFRARSPRTDIKARCNVFLPLGDEFRMAYRVRMNDALDTDYDLSFADTKSGLSGFAFTRRKAMVCNLEKIGELHASGKISASELFGMDKKLGGIVRADRTWLISVPIFDPSGIVTERWSDGMLEYKGEYYHELLPSIDGPVLECSISMRRFPSQKSGSKRT